MLEPPEQAETLDRPALLRTVQQVQRRPGGVRRPGNRHLPTETLLDRDRAAHPGQRQGVPRRPRPDPVLGPTPTQGQTPTGPSNRAPAIQTGRTLPPVRGRPADLRGPTPDPPRLGMVVPVGHQK